MKNKILEKIKERWGDNPIVMRSQIVEFSCGLISSIQIIKNLETQYPNIIKGKFVFGKRRVGYPTESVLEFLEAHIHDGGKNE